MPPIPLLFTLDGSSRHEVILVDPSDTDFSALASTIQSTIATSKNCEEFMAKYKKKPEQGDSGYGDGGEKVGSVKVRWATAAGAGRDAKSWPATTEVTEENVEAVLRLVELGGGRDVLEVKVGGE
ncbi:hypothetical protein K490DRAFT_58674 [Saccharata proteae CBS 121410]|uniref:Uncharacterized protein n=1 Tax=Saccharata proteae CBS 121410 TaxID=1314787 RepID=A0A9P4LVM9_9PEZI|nr:hypothetical protein K490DRAFT_58674 [Saccharata proteae CBS 121410]